MTEVTYVSNVGNFAVMASTNLQITGDSENEQATLELMNLASLGLGAMIGAVGAVMEKAMYGGGKRPEKWTRTDAVYTEALGKDVQNAASRKLDELSKEKKLPSVLFEVTGEYVSTEGKEVRKMADGVLATLAAADPAAMAAFGMVYGFKPEDTEDQKREKLVRHFNGLRK